MQGRASGLGNGRPGTHPIRARVRRFLELPEVRFPLRFAAWATALWLFIQAPVGVLPALQSGTLQLVSASAALTGLPNRVEAEAVVSFGPGLFRYQVTQVCTAWGPAVLLVAAVLAYPASWRRRASGLLVGLPLLLMLNVVRLVSMAWLGVRWPDLFEQAHGFWWQALVILSVALGWLAWAHRLEAERSAAGPQGTVRQAAVAFAVFLAAAVSLEAVGVWTGAIHGYGSAVQRASFFAAAHLAGARDLPPMSTEYDALCYGGLAAVVSLYLATPRVAWPRRLLAAVALGVPLQVAFDLLGSSALVAVVANGAGSGAFVLITFLSMGGSAVAWSLWARRARAPALAQAGAYACPACASRTDDLLGHIAEAHRTGLRRWSRRALRQHPGLRD